MTHEIQHKKRIGRTFALAAKPVTVEQFRQFEKGYAPPAVYTRTAEFPVVGISWYMAAKYCNWLSKEEGIPEEQWCYEINGDEIKLKSNYLSLTGYRLPTESEMEYATRAGAVTSGYYGETDELLPKYAWYNKNSKERTWPVGSLKPNDLGLFDVQGNVFTWCQESFKPYPSVKGEESAEDQEDGLSGQRCSRPCVAWRLVRRSSVVRAVRQPYQQRADLPGLRLRFPSGEDSFALTALLLCHPPEEGRNENGLIQ